MNHTVLFHTALLSFSIAAAGAFAQEPADTNYDESKVPRYELPDPLVCFDGRAVTDEAMWHKTRRPEILNAFATNIYGRTPDVETHLRFETTSTEPKALNGLATRKEIRIRLFEKADAPWIDLLLFIPNDAPQPVPMFLGLNYGNQGVHSDPSITRSLPTTGKSTSTSPTGTSTAAITRSYSLHYGR